VVRAGRSRTKTRAARRCSADIGDPSFAALISKTLRKPKGGEVGC